MIVGPEDAVNRDQILTVITIYWLTTTAASSASFYCESRITSGPRCRPGSDPYARPWAAVSSVCPPRSLFGLAQALSGEAFKTWCHVGGTSVLRTLIVT